MAVSVKTLEKRLKFVQKELSEVGDGTKFPMLVTLDQLAEITYRVKDAWFTAGSITLTSEVDGFSVYGVTIAGSPSGLPNVVEENSTSFFRGYWVGEPNTTITPINYLESFFGEEYSTASPFFFDFNPIRDATSEFAMWSPILGGEAFFSTSSGSLGLAQQVKNAFSHYIVTFSPVGSYRLDEASDSGFGNGELGLFFNGEVAFVGSDNLLSPDASLYLGATFEMGDSASILVRSDAPSGFIDSGLKLQMVMASGTVECKLYFEQYTYGSSNPYLASGNNFVITATEWWPYAKNTPPEPVWNTATGEKL